MTALNMGSGDAHPFTIPLTKIDVAKRLVIGTAAGEVVDKTKEIMDYATARPQFESWSQGFRDATGGLSKGNLRVMHTKTVAGRLDDIAYDDASKQVQIVAKVVDDNEWKKCLDGVYTGFSIGGGYLKKWEDPDQPGVTRYTPIVREISLVDNPCMPVARFAELVKADGIVEQLPLTGVVRSFSELWAARPVPAPTFGELRKRVPLHQTLARLASGAVKERLAGYRKRADAFRAGYQHEDAEHLSNEDLDEFDHSLSKAKQEGDFTNAVARLHAAAEMRAPKSAHSELSDAEHRQRVEAAKARWRQHAPATAGA